MKKAQLLEILVEGSEVEILKNHVRKSLCHHHLLANPRNLPAPSNSAGSRSHKTRFEYAVCDVKIASDYVIGHRIDHVHNAILIFVRHVMKLSHCPLLRKNIC